ncbi:MAG: sulfite exporter TauE/SafE family protein [Alphaproteobacteria bacterium]|nr:sulfite exporter TauE/SafE family protein [Alphaproteobacteria bacterium]
MTGWLHGIAALCASAPPALLQAGMLPGLLLLGAAGSVVHCVPMCGAFVLGQAADRLAGMPAGQFCERRRIASGMLLPYHIGRLTTYASLGAVAGLAGGALTHLPWPTALNAAPLLLAASLFLAQALRRALPARRPAATRHPPGRWARAVATLAAKARRSRPDGGFMIGAALGFLPCGFLYGALALAAASGSAATGALALLAFGAGTVPALALLGIAGGAAARASHPLLAVATPIMLGANAAVLGVLGVGMLLR